jgi:hypothetical protein
MFDGSVTGVPILKSTGAKVLPLDSGIALEKGAIDIGRQSDLDSLQSFTIEAEITPSSLGGTRQNIIEGRHRLLRYSSRRTASWSVPCIQRPGG